LQAPQSVTVLGSPPLAPEHGGRAMLAPLEAEDRQHPQAKARVAALDVAKPSGWCAARCRGSVAVDGRILGTVAVGLMMPEPT
jgi:hypothetical protein